MGRLHLEPPRVPEGLELDAEASAEIRRRLAEDEAAEVERITRRWEERQARRKYARLGLEPADAEQPCNVSLADELLAWLSTPGRGHNALLWGDVGTGKTACAKRVLLRFPGGGAFLSEANMASALRSCFRGTGDAERFTDAWCRAPLLVLDDMGKAAGAEYRDWLAASVWEVADRRWMAGLPTLVTANERGSDLVARFGDPTVREAVYSRLFAGAKVKHLAGRDRRADDA